MRSATLILAATVRSRAGTTGSRPCLLCSSYSAATAPPNPTRLPTLPVPKSESSDRPDRVCGSSGAAAVDVWQRYGEAVKLFDVMVVSGDPCVPAYTSTAAHHVNAVKWNHNSVLKQRSLMRLQLQASTEYDRLRQ